MSTLIDTLITLSDMSTLIDTLIITFLITIYYYFLNYNFPISTVNSSTSIRRFSGKKEKMTIDSKLKAYEAAWNTLRDTVLNEKTGWGREVLRSRMDQVLIESMKKQLEDDD